MVITNGCVTLRAIEEKDFDILYEMMNSEAIEKAMGHCTLPLSRHQHREWIANYRNTKEQIRLMIELENGATIGVIMLFDIDMRNGTAEVGYKISAPKDNRLKGDMTDALCGMLNFAFDELRLNCVTARAIEGNEASIRLLERVGFSKEGALRQRLYQSGRYCDVISFSVLKSEYKAVRV